MDLHLGPMQHQATIACEIAREAAAAATTRTRTRTRTRAGASPAPPLDEEKTDDEHSWVMLKPGGEIEPLEGESILLKTPDYVSLELRVPQGMRTANPNFSLKCDDGVAYVTNKRVSRPHPACRPGVLSTARPADGYRSSTLPPSLRRHSSPSLLSSWIRMTRNPGAAAGSGSEPGAGRLRQGLDPAAAFPLTFPAWSSP